jgi:hypothetical protein
MCKRVSGISLMLLAAVGFASLPGPSAATPSICNAIPGNLIVNCGFETKGLFGWTESGNTDFTFIATHGSFHGLLADPNSGDWFAALGPLGSDGFLSQTLIDTAGQQLRVEFFLASDGGSPNDFHASFNDNMLLSLTNDGAHGFTDYVFILMATGLDTLTIGGYRHDIGFFGLDDVSVVPVPEPRSVGLLGISLAGLGIELGRRASRSRRTRGRR